MSDLLVIYFWTICAGGLSAAALAIMGCHLAARDKGMQTLCLGQGAMFGILLTVGLLGYEDQQSSDWVAQGLPLSSATAFCLLVAYLGLLLDRHRIAAKTSYYIGIFALLLSMNYLVSALLPGLETHMAQVFFGDLATLSAPEVGLCLAVASCVLCLLIAAVNPSTNTSFTSAILGDSTSYTSPFERLSSWICFFYICFAILHLGFLFTVTALFIPTIAMNLSGLVGLRLHLLGAAAIACLGTVAGFIFSLWMTRLPTVPTITVFFVLFGLLARGAGWLSARYGVQQVVKSDPVEAVR